MEEGANAIMAARMVAAEVKFILEANADLCVGCNCNLELFFLTGI